MPTVKGPIVFKPGQPIPTEFMDKGYTGFTKLVPKAEVVPANQANSSPKPVPSPKTTSAGGRKPTKK